MTDKLLDIFLAEAQDLIVEIEKALLLLEQDERDQNAISAVFRAMHTLKGSSGMFGFESVSAITHHLENIYQDIRDGAVEMSAPVLEVTFKTLDHLRALMSDPHLKDSNNRENHANLLAAILDQQQKSDPAQPVVKINAPSSGNEAHTYYVYLLPHDHVIKNGTNVLYLVDDLLALGEGLSFPFFHKLPELNDLAPDASHMGFEVILSTATPEQDIHEVFLFVDSDCNITITRVAEGNKIATLHKKELNQIPRSSPLGIEGFRALIAGNKRESVAEKVKNAYATSVRVSGERLDELMNLVSELVTTQARLSLFSNHNASPELAIISEHIEKITRRLRDNAFTMSLVPLENLVVRFQRLVNDLSKELNKEIVFKTEGTDTEIDKSIIEKLTDPLLHLLRNSIDHGIETPAARIAKGKPAKGTVHVRSYYSGANVVIEIGDDGAGLDLDRIREKAVAKGLIDGRTHLEDSELVQLIFLPGFSTAEKITGVSGRGVGMDVVKRNISDIRGEIDVVTKKDKGTSFIITLPLTLSILDGLLVKIGETDFILPLTAVAKCYEVETTQLESTYNQWMTFEGRRIPFFHLRNDFGITDHKPRHSQVITVNHNGAPVGLAVDKIEGEYQAVLKPLGDFYRGQHEFSGATILGNGHVALVLDPHKLIAKLNTLHKN